MINATRRRIASSLPTMTSRTGRRVATTVGAATAVIGGALLAAPQATGPLLGLTDVSGARAVGVLDLALVPGLLVGRPRWPWLTARAAANLATAAYCLHLAPTNGEMRRARAIALAFTLITVGDSLAVQAMRRGT